MSVAARPSVQELAPYVPGRAARDVGGASVIKLSSNEAAFLPLPSVTAAVTDALHEMNRYPDMRAVALTDAVAQLHGVEPDWVAVGGGSTALIRHLADTFVGPGDEVAFGAPTFDVYATSARIAGGSATSVRLHDGELDFDELLAAVGPETKLVFVCTPNNPTGNVVSHHDLDAFVQSVPSDVLVVVDEAYRHFVTVDGAADGVALARAYDNVAALRSFSKAYGLAGLRAGYCIARPDVLAPMRRVITPFSISMPAQVAAFASLRPEAERELMERVASTVRERTRVAGELRSLGWDGPEPQGNFVWFPVGNQAGAFAVACEDGGILVRSIPGEGVRVTVGTAEENDAFLAVAAAIGVGGGA